MVKRESATAVVAALTSASRSLSVGGVNVTGQTYSGLAAAIADYQSTSEATASSNSTSLSATTTTLQTRLTNEIGVNTDTEMAQLTVLENDYAANAKVISTVQSMFDTLFAIST
jgi:flagellar hook-associated protein 1 FlgK